MSRDITVTLRTARDMMNHRGKHWIKGAEKQLVHIESHEPGEVPIHVAYTPQPGYEPAYCSVGALHEVGAGRDAFVELAKAINPKLMKAVLEEEEARALATGDEDDIYDSENVVYDEARDVIMNFNDDTRTTWADVRSAFTKAARNAARRKR